MRRLNYVMSIVGIDVKKDEAGLFPIYKLK